MKILQIHNGYQTGHGGEDSVIANEGQLLSGAGHEVLLKKVTTGSEHTGGAVKLLKTSARSIYSMEGRRLVREWIREVRPDVVHVHNTFPLLSPAIFHEIARCGVPSVLTLHNYRLVCANALFLRDGRACDLCLTKSPLNAVKYRCYKDSLAGSLVQSQTIMLHDLLGTYRSSVDAVITLSDFARDIFVRKGIPEEVLHVKPNFVRPIKIAPCQRKDTFVFVGKLVPEKGVDQLLKAWSELDTHGWSLQIVGDGPERQRLEEQYPASSKIEWVGWKSQEEVRSLVASSRALVLPSVWYEGFPMVLVEAFTSGTPAIVPNLGAMPNVVAQGNRGLVYDGSLESLKIMLQKAMSLPAAEYDLLSRACLDAVENEYSPETNLRKLLEIYTSAITVRKKRMKSV